MREILLSILVAAIAYLLGCFSTGLTVSGAKGVDIRNRGSKNTGASNVLRVMGLKSGLITFAGDFLKAALACWIGSLILPGTTFGIARYGMMLAGLFVLLVGVVSQYRFRYVLNRMHAASMGDSLGMLLVLTGLCISQNDGWVILKYLLTALFLWLTSPTGSHLIARLELTTNEHPEQEMEMINL